MANKLYLHPNDDTQNLSFCGLKLVLLKHLDKQLKELINQNSISQRIRKHYYKTIGTIV